MQIGRRGIGAGVVVLAACAVGFACGSNPSGATSVDGGGVDAAAPKVCAAEPAIDVLGACALLTSTSNPEPNTVVEVGPEVDSNGGRVPFAAQLDQPEPPSQIPDLPALSDGGADAGAFVRVSWGGDGPRASPTFVDGRTVVARLDVSLLGSAPSQVAVSTNDSLLWWRELSYECDTTGHCSSLFTRTDLVANGSLTCETTATVVACRFSSLTFDATGPLRLSGWFHAAR